MKFFSLCCLLAVIAIPALSQKSGSLNSNGGRFAGFTIDGDTKAGHTKIYPSGTPYLHDDDWFKPAAYAGIGRSIIDTTGAAVLKARLEAKENIAFTKRMVGQPYDIKAFYPTGNPLDGGAGQFWVDGVYFRDYYNNDSSAFTSANKNGQNPNDWFGGVTNTGGKTDIVDVFTHVRTTGVRPGVDSVWFFAGVSTKNVVGERYFDIEVYREPISFTPSPTGVGQRFVSAGTSFGHSKWTINSTGDVVQTGDIIISVSYKSGAAPEIDFRIWLAKSTYDSIVATQLVPKRFKLNGKWDLADDGQHGYAEITAPNAIDEWGSGLGNYTGNALADSTYATPWGTVNTGGDWSQNYDQLQFVEIGLNFSRFGMDPFTYVTSFCKSPYAAIIVKSRSSTAFSANLDDFVGPVPFSVKNVVPFTVTPDAMTCIKDSSKLLFEFQARNYYRLLNSNGDTLAKDVDFRTAQTAADRYLTVKNTGTYRVEATNFQGCPAMDTKTIQVVKDDIKPDAGILIGSQDGMHQLIGMASTPASAFGPSQGYTYSWKGPDGSTLSSYTAKEPLITTYVTGTYDLTVTENRNGCTGTANAYVMATLNNRIHLQAKATNEHIELIWNNPDPAQAASFVIERSYDGNGFEKVGQLAIAANSSKLVTYPDAAIVNSVFYRVKTIKADGSSYYSNTVHVKPGAGLQKVTVQKKHNTIQVAVEQCTAQKVYINVLDMSGRLLVQQAVPAQPSLTQATVYLPTGYENKPVLVTVAGDGTLLQTKKVL